MSPLFCSETSGSLLLPVSEQPSEQRFAFQLLCFSFLHDFPHPPSLFAPPLTSSSRMTSSAILIQANKKKLFSYVTSGSDSSSSVGSSSGSLPRPAQLSLPAPVLPQPSRGVTLAPAAALPAPPVGGNATTPAAQSSTTNSNINANASFYIVPLDTSAIPPGSVLLNPQTGG